MNMRKCSKPALLSLLLSPLLFNSLGAGETLTWKSCIEEARKNHPDLISAQEDIRQSEATKTITKSSAYPQVDSSVTASRAKTTTTSSGKTSGKTANSYSYGVSGSQLIFDGAKTLNNVKSATEDIKAAQYGYTFTSSDVRLRLRTAFIDVLKAQELLKITREIFDIRRGNFELITLRYESGIEHKGALLTAQANLAQAEFEITQAKRSLEVAQRELVKEMGRKQFSPLLVEGDFSIKERILEKPDFETLAENNPSLARLVAQKNSASYGIKAAKADFYPTLSVSAGASRSGSRFLPQNDQLNAGLTLSLPIFEGNLRSAELSKARSVFTQAEADERSTKDSLILGLEQSWASLLDSIDTVDVRRKFLAAAEERARIAEAQYSLGLIQFDNWTIIEDDLVRAKKNLLDAEASALLAEAGWVQAKGETLEYAD